MPEWIALSRSAHAEARYVPRRGYAHAEGQAVLPVQLAELSRLLPHYALALVVHESGYRPVALLSLDGTTNLYLHPDGRWLCPYVPAALRGWPFTLARDEARQVLCLEKGALVQAPEGAALFDEAGELAAPVAGTLRFLEQCERGREATARATRALNEAGVIAEWPLDIPGGEGAPPRALKGLYGVDEKALNALGPEALVALRDAGGLALAYGLLFSRPQTERLTALEKARATFDPAAPAEPAPWGEAEDELTFDFDS